MGLFAPHQAVSFVSSFSNINLPNHSKFLTKMTASRECYQITLVVFVVIFAFSAFLLVACSIEGGSVGQIVGGGGMFISGVSGYKVYKAYCREYPTANATARNPAVAHAELARLNHLSNP